jgi:hypothetical protein
VERGRNYSQQEFLRFIKTQPERALQVYKRGVNVHLSPATVATIHHFVDTAVDDNGNIDPDVFSSSNRDLGIGTAVAILVLAAVAFGAGFAVGEAVGGDGGGEGGCDVTVLQGGQGEVNVNTNGRPNGGDGGDNGGGNGGRRVD